MSAKFELRLPGEKDRKITLHGWSATIAFIAVIWTAALIVIVLPLALLAWVLS
jgi:hypothetical protein